MEEIFESSVRSSGDLAGVLEFDGETTYFYLYECEAVKKSGVVTGIPICMTPPDFCASDVVVRWDDAENVVGLFIHGVLWAAIDDESCTLFGGRYALNAPSTVPPEVAVRFS